MAYRTHEISSGSILRISDAKTLELIDLYQKEECLWNTHIEDYKNKEKRSQAARRIATTLDIPNFTEKHVIMKFKNIRNSYSQEQKKIALSKVTGATDEYVYTPRVFWYSKLDSFLKPHLQWRDKQTAEKQQLEIAAYKSGTAQEWVLISEDHSELPLNPKVIMVDSPSSSDEDRSNESSKKRKRTPKAKREQKFVLQSLKNIQSDLRELMSNNDDHFDTFGKYVASMMRSLPSQKASVLEPEIISLILSATMNSRQQPEVEDSSTLLDEDYQNSLDDIVVKIEREE